MNIATNENVNHRDRDTTTDRDLRKDQRTSPQKAATTKGETTTVLPLHYYTTTLLLLLLLTIASS